MQGLNTFIFEELDQPSKDYLLAVGNTHGKVYPGIYSNNKNGFFSLFVIGFLFLIGIPIVNFFDTFAEPKAQAMLQTALFLMGSWFLLLALRHGCFFSGNSGLRSFIFIDGKYYWNCNHYSVNVANIENVQTFDYIFNDQFKTYDFNVVSDQEAVIISVYNEKSAADLYSLLFYKSNNTEDSSEIDNAFLLDEALKDLPSSHVPNPFKEGKEKVRFFGIGVFVLVMAFAFYLLLRMNISFRDDQIWQSILPINSDEKVYWLRIYLRDTRNTLHRDEAIKKLGEMYKHAFEEIAKSKSIVDKDDKFNSDFISKNVSAIDPKNLDLANLIPMAKMISVPAPKLIQGLQSIVLPRMLDLQEPFLKLSVVPADIGSTDSSKLIGAITDAYIHSVVHEFGSEYFLLSSSLDGPGHITIVYSFIGEKDEHKICFEVLYRQSSESEPIQKTTMEVRIPSRDIQYVERAAKRLGVFTMGDRSGEWAFPK